MALPREIPKSRIGESGIWFFSLMWEHGSDVEPVEFLDDKNVLETMAEADARTGLLPQYLQ